MQACTRQFISPTLALCLELLRQAILMPRSAKVAHSTNQRMNSALHGGFAWVYEGAASRAARAGLPPTTGAGSSTGNAPVSIAQLPCRQPPGGLTLAQRCAALRTVKSMYGAHYKILSSDVPMRLLPCGWPRGVAETYCCQTTLRRTGRATAASGSGLQAMLLPGKPVRDLEFAVVQCRNETSG